MCERFAGQFLLATEMRPSRNDREGSALLDVSSEEAPYAPQVVPGTPMLMSHGKDMNRIWQD